MAKNYAEQILKLEEQELLDWSAGELIPFFMQIPPEKIVLLKSILESYDEIGILRTIDQRKGDIVVFTLPELADDLREILNSLRERD